MDNIKYKIQRALNGFSDQDLWSFDEYLATIIKDGCFRLSEECSSHPDGFTEKKWKQTLKEISFGFGSYLEMRSGIYSFEDKEFKRLSKEYKKGLSLLIKHFDDLWD